MITKLIDKKNIDIAAKIIQNGGIVAFPTETVYGLGANAFDVNAIKKIYQAKNRPSDNPLIVHIYSLSQLKLLTNNITPKAKKLIKKFWPGPLTIIFDKKNNVPDIVTANLKSVAVRMPKNKTALDLIKKSNCPIAAPSANTSTLPSPTYYDHVVDDLSGRADAIILDKPSEIGIESTVVDITEKMPIILRPGIISKNDIQKVIGKVANLRKKYKKTKSPGTKYRHYAPRTYFVWVQKNYYKNNIKYLIKNKKSVVLLTNKNNKYNARNIYIGTTPAQVAKNLYATLRMLDKQKFDIIVMEPIGKSGAWEAIANRLQKAATKIIR